MEKIEIAKACYEANRIYCQSIGDNSQSSWEEAAAWQKMSVLNGVEFHQANPEATPEDSHENWVNDKVLDGWKWGPVKDAAQKTHPCLQSFDKIPEDQQRKDIIFLAVAKAFTGAKKGMVADQETIESIIKKAMSVKLETLKEAKPEKKKTVVEKVVEKLTPKKTTKNK